MARACPNCGATMDVDVIHEISLDVCPNCGGTWFQADSLRSLLETAPHGLEDVAAVAVPHVEQTKGLPSQLLCPNDGTALDNYHYMYDTPVILHTCSKCGGFWVAAGEVAKMEQLRDQTHAPMTDKERLAFDYGSAIAEHEQEMSRLNNMESFFNHLRRYQPGWYGFI